MLLFWNSKQTLISENIMTFAGDLGIFYTALLIVYSHRA